MTRGAWAWLALGALSLPGCHKYEASAEDYEKIHEGMTRGEVDQALEHLGRGGAVQEADGVWPVASGVVLARYGTPTHALFVGFDNQGHAKQRALRLPKESRDEALGTVSLDPQPPRPTMERAEPIPEGIYAADDLHALSQGKWRLKRSVFDGEELHDDVTWTFDLDRLSVQLKMGAPSKLSYRLDPTRSPKRFATGAQLTADGKGANAAGIYALDGDTLKICVDPSNRHFPAAFESVAGAHLLLQEFERE